MKKVLFVANTHKHFRAFHVPYIKMLQKWGYEVHVAANDEGIKIPDADKQWIIPINRWPFSLDNINAVSQIKQLIRQEQYVLVHCHTAMGAVVARLAARPFRAKGLRVLYTAHGFHFFKGSPKHYWLMYYPMEKYLSQFTDAIITMNEEDYKMVQERKFRNIHTFKIPGVGVKRKKFSPVSIENKLELRIRLGLPKDAWIMIYAAEYISRKNHAFLLQAMTEIKKDIPSAILLLAGRGRLYEEVASSIRRLELQNNVFQLGFRDDIDSLYKLSDVVVSSSKQEGLPIHLVEAMMCGLPAVVSIERGHKELVEHSFNGFEYPQNNVSRFTKYIARLEEDTKLFEKMRSAAIQKAEQFELSKSLLAMERIYKQFLSHECI